MSRAADLELKPADRKGCLTLGTYTYDSTQPAKMRETVYLDGDAECVSFMARLTPDEARQLAKHLVQVAELCERARDERIFDEDLEEQLRDPDSAINQGLVTVVRDGVVYGHGADKATATGSAA